MNTKNTTAAYPPEDRKRYLRKFLLASAAGIFLFAFPFKGTIPVAWLSTQIKNVIAPVVPTFATIIFLISGLGALYVKVAKPDFVEKNQILKKMFVTSWIWIFFRLLAIVFAVMILFNFGPEFIISPATGGDMLNSIIVSSTVMLMICSFALPLLIEFGLMEFVGVMLNNVFRRLFNIPGRAAVDCISSWLGASNIAVVLTDAQYKAGGYSLRESAVIMTCFSACSISSALVFLSFVELEDMFVPFYLTVTLMGIICAIIMPRIPPLSRKKETYYNNINNATNEVVLEGHTKFSWAVECALNKAKESYTIKSFFLDGAENALHILFKVIPIILSIGTIALILSEYTSIYTYLGLPFVPLFKLLGLPEASVAAGTLIGGFADNYIPCIIAGNTISSPLTKFVVTFVTYNSILYLTGPAGVILQCETKVGFGELFVIYLERVVLSIILGGIFSIVLFNVIGI